MGFFTSAVSTLQTLVVALGTGLAVAGLVLTFVMCYELIQMLIDRNNLHDIDTWIFFKWIFKTFVAVLLLSNTFNIVMSVFDVS